MAEKTGWLIDLYADETGLVLWLLCDAGPRLPLRMDFPVNFSAAGDFKLLRQAWRFLQDKDVTLTRTTRRDLFTGEREVLSVTVPRPGNAPGLFAELLEHFPDLDYYDADIPLPLRFAARTGVGLLGRCRIDTLANRVAAIEVLDSPWELDPAPIPLRILKLSPDVDPALHPPRQLRVQYEQADYSLSLDPFRTFEIALGAVLQKFDPDLILTDYGDTWLFPKLILNPNRDPARQVLTKKAESYFAYGQVVYRGAQAHLYGRWHIDRRNAMLFGEYGLDGVLEQARVTGLGIQEMARKSPGAGITAMQMLTALRAGILVPFQKQQAEGTKTLADLVRADKGGMIYQPLVGVHTDVAQIDFASMYPSIMVNRNTSPETIGQPAAPDGLIPQTLRPLLEKRLALKKLLTELHPLDCRVKSLKARAAALKWLLVVCFGYLGYKNARFGKIESHEAVTSISRELLLQAKEVAEELGFLVIHMYVDCLFVQKPGCRKPADFTPLMEAIAAQTGIPLALDGVYRWVAFLPSKRDKRIPVPNRYFGVFQACPEHGRRVGEIKYRGIEARRHDTPAWVTDTQMKLLETLARAESLKDVYKLLPDALILLNHEWLKLQAGQVPLEKLLITQKLTRELDAYQARSPVARAVLQLSQAGKTIQPGQNVRYLLTLGNPGVYAWDLGKPPGPAALNYQKYLILLVRAASTILQPFGVNQADLYEWTTRGQKPLKQLPLEKYEPVSLLEQ